MSRSTAGRRVAALFTAFFLVIFSAGLASAHEEREVAGYDVEVGFIGEPVYVGDKSGLEFFVHKGDVGVTGLESTLKAEVIYQDQKRDLPISAREDDDGAYESVFIPTAAGPYTFHIFGTIEGNAVDESFTSSPTGFDEVGEVASGEFPIQYPSTAELATMAQSGQDAASQATLALGVAVVGVVLGAIGVIGLIVVMRRRPA